MKKRKLTSDLSLKIVSLLIGILIWLVISNMDDPTITVSFTTNVTVANSALAEQLGMMVMTAEDQGEVRVYLTGERSKLRRITASDLEVVADLSQALSFDTDPVMVPITVSCEGISQSNIEVSPTNYAVYLREKVTQEFTVSVTSGDSKPASGYEIANMYSDPAKVKITGPSTLVNKIGTVTATVNVAGATEDVVQTSDLVLYDKNGEAFSEDEMSNMNISQVNVYAALWKTVSDIKVTAQYQGEPASGYKVGDITVVPDQISVAGSQAALEKLKENNNTITIPASAIDISGQTKDVEQVLELANYLDEDLKLSSNSSSDVTVTVAILPVSGESYQIHTKDIRTLNIPENYLLAFDTDSIEIRIEKEDDSLPDLDSDDIKASVDLSGMKPGTYTLSVDIEIPEGYTLVENASADVTLSETTQVETQAQQ